MIGKIIDEIESLISVLKVKIYDLQQENKNLKNQIKKLHSDLENFININK